jgi:hypothetical protein
MKRQSLDGKFTIEVDNYYYNFSKEPVYATIVANESNVRIIDIAKAIDEVLNGAWINTSGIDYNPYCIYPSIKKPIEKLIVYLTLSNNRHYTFEFLGVEYENSIVFSLAEQLTL